MDAVEDNPGYVASPAIATLSRLRNTRCFLETVERSSPLIVMVDPGMKI